MAYTQNSNFTLLPTGATNWVNEFNANFNKLELGPTITTTAAATIVKYKCFYVDSAGKAAIATDVKEPCGIWYSTTTALDETGYGQVEGIAVNVSWTWGFDLGKYLYAGSDGFLTTTISKSGIRVAYVINATTVFILPLMQTSRKAIQTVTGTYAPLETDEIILCNASGGAVTINLPTSVGKQGKEYCIIKTDSSVNTVTIDGNSTETINTDQTRVLTYQYESLNPISNNTNWITRIPNVQGIIQTAPVDKSATPIVPTRTGKYFFHVQDVLNAGIITCPTITSAAFGKIIATTVGGAITEYAYFTVNYLGTVVLLTDISANVVANANTGSKLCIGTSVANPLIIKNNLGSTKSILVVLEYD